MKNDDNRIAFIINGLPVGGAEKFFITVVNHFNAMGFEPLVVLLNNQNQLLHELNPNVQVNTIIKRSRFDLFVSFRIKKYLVTNNIDKVFCINAYPFFMTKLAFIFNNKTRFFLSLHSTIPNTFRIYIKNFLCYRFVSKKDVIVYLCNNQKGYLKHKYLIPKSQEYIISNGIDKDFFNVSSLGNLNYNKLRLQYNIPLGEKLIVKVARISPEKGHQVAIDALHILHAQFNQKSHLLFVGGGDSTYILSLKFYAESKNIHDYVHFVDAQADVRKFYYIADIFTLTSKSETFSLAALEAMAFGLPISLTNIGGASEMMIEGVTGQLAKPNNAFSIASSWNYIQNNIKKGEHIRHYFLNNFTADRMLQDYVNLLIN